MTNTIKILKWDFVLDSSNNKIPLISFKASPDFIVNSNINKQILYVNIKNTNKDSFNNKNYKATVDKSNELASKDYNQSDSCLSNFSNETVLYTLTLKKAYYIEGIAEGEFSLMPEYKPKKTTDKSKKSDKSNKKSDKSSDDLKDDLKDYNETLGMNALPLSLIGGILLSGALLTIFLIRRK
jgi:hypothetical protein